MRDSLAPDSLRRILIERAAWRYRKAGRFAWHFARFKLAGDPVFTLQLSHGLIPDGCRILDLGCGQGLLAAWLMAARESYRHGDWPADWPPPPELIGYRGIEIAAKEVGWGRTALADSNQQGGRELELEHGDVRNAELRQADVVVIMDVLHYMPHADHEEVLRRVRDALPMGGLFLTRVGNSDGGLPFLLSKWVDYSVAFLRWGRLSPLYCRSLSSWRRLLAECGFSVEPLPMCGRMGFANVLLIAKRIR